MEAFLQSGNWAVLEMVLLFLRPSEALRLSMTARVADPWMVLAWYRTQPGPHRMALIIERSEVRLRWRRRSVGGLPLALGGARLPPRRAP